MIRRTMWRCRNLLSVNVVNNRLLPSLAVASTASTTNNESARKQTRQKQNDLFDEEKKRQSSLIPRVEKIEVKVFGISSSEEADVTLLMNKNMSTPYDCSLHIHEHFSKMPFAEVDDRLWDMHRPLKNNCSLRFREFDESNPIEPNRAFWRSCSFLLGMVIERGIKEETGICLHSWPRHDASSGSFVYDVVIPSVDEWHPTRNELLALTNVFWKIRSKDFMFERLVVKNSLAREIFAHNPYKVKQLQSMANDREDVTLYRAGDHIDISVGPMVSSTAHVGRVNVTAVHRLEKSLFRFQGVAIPASLRMNHFAFNILIDQAKNVNHTPPLLESNRLIKS